MWYVQNKKTHVKAFKDDYFGDGVIYYVILRKDNPYGAKKLSNKLIDMFFSAWEGITCTQYQIIHVEYTRKSRGVAGVKDSRLNDKQDLVDLCASLRIVADYGEDADNPDMEPIPECSANVGKYR